LLYTTMSMAPLVPGDFLSNWFRQGNLPME
jgi:hypothetical protein